MKSIHISWIVSCLLLALAIALKSFEPPLVVDFQNRTFDFYQQMHPRPYEPAPVRIIDIDDTSLTRIGQWPWPRSVIADLVEKLRAAGASAILFDIVFAEPDRTSPGQILPLWKNAPDQLQEALSALPDHDELLARAIAAAPVVTGFVLTQNAGAAERSPESKSSFSFAGKDPSAFALSFTGAVTSLPLLEKAAKGNGALNNKPDRDGIMRRIPLVMRLDKLYPSLGSEGLRVAQGAGGYVIKTVGASGESGDTPGMIAVKIGSLVIPTDTQGNQWLYYSLPAPERTVSAWQVLDGTADPAKLAGNIVVIGTSAAGLKDIRATPLSPVVPGVEVFAQGMEQALLGITLSRPDWIRGAEIVLMAVAGLLLLLVNRVLSPLWGACFMAAMIAATVAVSWQAFASYHLLIEPVMPVLTVALMYFSDSLARYIRSDRERLWVRHAFAHYMSPDLVETLASQREQLTLGGETRRLSVMFCDMRNFTVISESLSPMALTSLLSRFLTPMTDVILSHRGTIDKYIGDCIMAFWNAPLHDERHAAHAASAALAMREALRKLNTGQPLLPIGASISINTGECCVGNMGTPQRFNYSALGDEVNLASRLQSQCGDYGVDILLGEGTAREIQAFALIELDMIRVKGKRNAVRIYALLGDEAMGRDPAFVALRGQHDALLQSYRKREWDQAENLLKQCMQASGALLPLIQGYYARLAERIEYLKQHPPAPDWNGVHEAV